jgi:hypothetical protein
MTDDNIDDPRKAYAPPSAGPLEPRARHVDWLRKRRDELRSNIAVLESAAEPPPGRLEALRAELAGVEDELRALGVDP